jgi:hypothetical protein
MKKKKKIKTPKPRIPVYKMKSEQIHKTDKDYDRRVRRKEKQEIRDLLKKIKG